MYPPELNRIILKYAMTPLVGFVKATNLRWPIVARLRGLYKPTRSEVLQWLSRLLRHACNMGNRYVLRWLLASYGPEAKSMFGDTSSLLLEIVKGCADASVVFLVWSYVPLAI